MLHRAPRHILDAYPVPPDADSVNPGALARVARWRHSRCYERFIPSQGEDMGRRIWNEWGCWMSARNGGRSQGCWLPSLRNVDIFSLSSPPIIHTFFYGFFSLHIFFIYKVSIIRRASGAFLFTACAYFPFFWFVWL